MEMPEVMVASRTREAVEQLSAAIDAAQWQVRQRVITNGHVDPLHDIRRYPHALVFRISGAAELEALANEISGPRPATIIIGPAADAALMRLAMKMGARDYLPEPLSAPEFLESLAGVRAEAASAPRQQPGSITAVVGAKGGSGASVLAVNLAHMMVCESRMKTALVDLDLQFGCLGQYLDVKPQAGLLKALDMVEDLDEMALDACMAKHESGLSLLACGEEDYLLNKDIPAGQLARLLEFMRSAYDRIVIDLPRQVDEVSATVFEAADQVLLVVQQELTNVRDATRMRNILLRELAVPREHLLTVVNRYRKDGGIELDDLKRALSIEQEKPWLVPNNYRSVADSINLGVPLLESDRNGAVTRSLLGMEQKLGGRRRKNKAGFLSRAMAQLIRG